MIRFLKTTEFLSKWPKGIVEGKKRLQCDRKHSSIDWYAFRCWIALSLPCPSLNGSRIPLLFHKSRNRCLYHIQIPFIFSRNVKEKKEGAMNESRNFSFTCSCLENSSPGYMWDFLEVIHSFCGICEFVGMLLLTMGLDRLKKVSGRHYCKSSQFHIMLLAIQRNIRRIIW